MMTLYIALSILTAIVLTLTISSTAKKRRNKRNRQLLKSKVAAMFKI